ncbi:unnamed protein product [Larinioides sclopetarius]|uniref:Uncharacterized protein n=1 Tax=Larinioides sclopetarius TaxID=280406 RepID=A0AAV1YWU5_9ARAC
MENIKQDNECLVKTIEEMGKEEEIEKMREPLEECMKAALKSRRK